MDSEGIPIAFGLSTGNENEQNTMIPLEQALIATMMEMAYKEFQQETFKSY